MKDFLYEKETEDKTNLYKIINEYINKYSIISTIHSNLQSNDGKIIFKNILLEQQDDNEHLYKYINHNISPEEYIIEYYKSKGFNAFFAENKYWLILFLMFYYYDDFIKFPFTVEQSFITAIHDDYRIVKVESLDFTFTPLDTIPNLTNHIIDAYFNNLYYFYGEYIDIVEWDKKGEGLSKFINLDNLIVPVRYLDKQQLKLIFTRMADDFKYYTSGFPDLIVYNKNEFFFVEVKSKNDYPSFKQIQWHKFLSEVVGINVVLFMIDKSDDQVTKIKKSYQIDLEDSKKRKLKFIESDRKICINWNDDNLKSYMANVSDDEFNELIDLKHYYPKRFKKYIVNDYTPLTRDDFSNKEWKYYMQLEFIKSNELLFQKAKELYSLNTFEDFTPTNRQLERNKKAKSLTKKGNYLDAVNLYMTNVMERTGSLNTYNQLIYIFNKLDRFYDVIKLMDIAIPIFVTLDDKKNTLRFIFQRFAAINYNKSVPSLNKLSYNIPQTNPSKSKNKSKQTTLSDYFN